MLKLNDIQFRLIEDIFRKTEVKYEQVCIEYKIYKHDIQTCVHAQPETVFMAALGAIIFKPISKQSANLIECNFLKVKTANRN